MSNNVRVLLVGCGYMGLEYAKVLSAQGVDYMVVGRSEKGGVSFFKETGVKPICGGLDYASDMIGEFPEYAIVATPIDSLMKNAKVLLDNGVKRILVEKPAGFRAEEMIEIVGLAHQRHAKIYVAYNRRYYSSVIKALDMINQDGGVTSFSFEFTEWSNVVENTSNPQIEKDNWLLANSSHVIDLAFFLGGTPIEMSSYGKGELSWHKNGCIYVGAGKTDKGALFSYQANWNAPGRWGIEILTEHHRLYFRPLEKLRVQNKNSVEINEIQLEDELDIMYKPGLFRQTEDFLHDNTKYNYLLELEQQIKNYECYKRIACI